MKTAILTLALLALTYTSRDLSNVDQTQPPSKEETLRTYRAVYQDLKQFDFSKTIVRYNGIERASDPIRVDNGLTLPSNNINSKQSPNRNLSRNNDEYLAPGLEISLKADLLNTAQQKVLEIVYQHFKHFEIPVSLEVPGLSLSNLVIDLDPLDPSNLNMFFSPDDNSVVLDFQEIRLSANGNIDVQKWVHLSGTVGVKVRLRRLTVKVVFLDGVRDHNGLYKPQVSVQVALIDIPKDDLQIKVDLSYIPDFLANFIIKFIKGYALDSVKLFVNQFVPGDGTQQVNAIIANQYPINIPVNQTGLAIDLDLSTLLTQKIRVLQDRLLVSVDGIVTTPEDTAPIRPNPSIIHFDPKDNDNILLGISESLVDSALNSFANIDHHNIYSKILGPLKLQIKSNLDERTVTITQKDISLNRMLISVDALYFGFTVKAHYYIDAGLVVNWIDLNQGIVNISITRVKVTDFNFDCNIPIVQAYGHYLKDFIETFGVLVKGYEIGFRPVSIPYNIKFSKIGFELREGYMVILTDVSV